MTQTRYFTSTALPTTLSSSMTDVTTSMSLTSKTGLPTSYPFTILLEWGTANQEAVTVTQASTGTGPYTFANVTRGVDGTTGKAHSSGAVAAHGRSARDFNEPFVHLADTTKHHYAAANATEQGVYEDLDITGLVIRRTDTLEEKIWTGSAWKIIGGLDEQATFDGTQRTTTSGAWATFTGAASLSVTVPSSGKLMVQYGSRMHTSTAGSTIYMGVDLSGANTVAQSDTSKCLAYLYATSEMNSVIAVEYTGLTAGSTTVSMVAYRTVSGTANIYNQWIYARGVA